MAMRILKSEILREARVVTKKKSLRARDIVEWSMGEEEAIVPRKDEKIFKLPGMGMRIAVLKSAL